MQPPDMGGNCHRMALVIEHEDGWMGECRVELGRGGEAHQKAEAGIMNKPRHTVKGRLTVSY